MGKAKLFVLLYLLSALKNDLTYVKCHFKHEKLKLDCDAFETDFDDITAEDAKKVAYFQLLGKRNEIKRLPEKFTAKTFPNLITISIGPYHLLECSEIVGLTRKFPQIHLIAFKNCSNYEAIQCIKEHKVKTLSRNPVHCNLSSDGHKLECNSTNGFDDIDGSLALNVRELVFKDFNATTLPELRQKKWSNLKIICLTGLEETFCEDVINIGNDLLNVERISFKQCTKKPVNVKCNV